MLHIKAKCVLAARRDHKIILQRKKKHCYAIKDRTMPFIFYAPLNFFCYLQHHFWLLTFLLLSSIIAKCHLHAAENAKWRMSRTKKKQQRQQKRNTTTTTKMILNTWTDKCEMCFSSTDITLVYTRTWCIVLFNSTEWAKKRIILYNRIALTHWHKQIVSACLDACQQSRSDECV